MAPIYNRDVYFRIGQAIGLPAIDIEAFDGKFEAAAMWYRMDFRSPKRMTPSELKKRLKSISGHATKLLKQMGISNPDLASDGPDDPDILQILVGSKSGLAPSSRLGGRNDEDIVLEAAHRLGCLVELLAAIQAAADFENWVKTALADTVHTIELISHKGHVGDWAASEWIAHMMSIYKELTDRNPGTSTASSLQENAGEATGPLIRFLTAAGRPIGLKMSPDAWRQRVRTLLRGAAEQK